MADLNPKRTVLLAKIEATYNTDPTPVEAADAVLIENPAMQFEGARMHERNPTKPSLGALNSLYAGSLMTVTFDVDIKGSGTAGTAPEYGPLLRACGLGEAIVAVTSVTYEPVSTAFESVTIYWFVDGLKYILTGCRGTVTGAVGIGATAKLSFSMTGHFTGPTDVALAAPTYSAITPLAMLNLTSFTVDSFAAIVSAINFDLGLEVGTPDDLSATDGFGEVQISGRRVTGSIDPMETLVATYDWVTKWKADTAAVLTTGAIGAAGNIFNLSFPKAQYTELSSGDRAGMLTRDITFLAGENVADDEISLVFT